jgi:uncharacterized protein YbjT (DUF2867 family)
VSRPRAKLVALGCSGPVAAPVINGFIEGGLSLRILARCPEPVARRYPGAEVAAGSMSDPVSVSQVLADADAAFLMTPMGMRNDPSGEIAIAKQVLEGAKAAGLGHLIYTSVLHADQPSPVGILQAKYEIERLIKNAGIPYTILRCGSYMEDVFDPRLKLLQKGRFLFPIDKHQTFSYTSQADIPRFVVTELLQPGGILNRAIDFVAIQSYPIVEIEKQLAEAAGFAIKTTPKFPVFYLFYALLPYFRMTKHRFSSVIPLMQHFDRNGYFSVSGDMQSEFPDFRMTSLPDHLRRLFET